MNVYEVRAKKDEEIYRIEMTEQTLEEATEHYNFWAEPDWKLGTDMEIIETGIDYSIDEYPYRAEDAMREILKNKEEFYGLLANSKACEQDKKDLHELVEQENVWEFGHSLPRLAGLYMGKQKMIFISQKWEILRGFRMESTFNKKFEEQFYSPLCPCKTFNARVKFLLITK